MSSEEKLSAEAFKDELIVLLGRTHADAPALLLALQTIGYLTEQKRHDIVFMIEISFTTEHREFAQAITLCRALAKWDIEKKRMAGMATGDDEFFARTAGL